MRFELLLCVLVLALMLLCFFAIGEIYLRILLTSMLLVLLLVHCWVTPYRWQIVPLWFVLLATQVSFVLDTSVKGPGWFALLLLCTSGVSLSVALVVGIPLLKLPVPDGRFGIGAITHALVDPDRPAFETSTDKGRRILVKIWYPSDRPSSSNGRSREPMWADFYRGAEIPRSLRWFTAYLRSIPTNTVPGAPFATGIKNPRLLIYNLGMISSVSENTTLMEYLASHGYVVFSIQHLDQLAEYHALNEEVSETEKERNKALLKRLTPSMGRDEMAEGFLELIGSSSVMNRMVATRAIDTDYVLNHAPVLFAKIPSLENCAPSVDRVGLVGFSLGGAVSTEFSKKDGRCAAVVNMDGGLYGTRIEDPISVPYLMMEAEHGEGANDLLLKNATSEMQIVVMPQTKHMDFFDAKLVWPIFRLLRALGRAPRQEFLVKKNETIREHFEHFLGKDATSD